jgi:hypothetical protein
MMPLGQFVDRFFNMMDVDGDSIKDIVTLYGTILRSSTGKSARTRTWRDVDNFVSLNGTLIWSLGYLSGSRYAMFGITRTLDVPSLVGYCGGPRGPNDSYDAAISAADIGAVEPPFYDVHPIPDVTGDGWDDLLTTDFEYYVPSQYGYVVLVAGGDYIKNDDPSASVAISVSTPGVVNIWPNPAFASSTVSWNVAMNISEVDLIDVLGRTIARNDISQTPASLELDLTDLPNGQYFVRLLSTLGTATTAKLAVHR